MEKPTRLRDVDFLEATSRAVLRTIAGGNGPLNCPIASSPSLPRPLLPPVTTGVVGIPPIDPVDPNPGGLLS
jgi:hypothetical protein